MGMELKSIGVDVTFSPVCDIFFPDGNEVIGSRSFSENPKAVLTFQESFVKDLMIQIFIQCLNISQDMEDLNLILISKNLL